MENKGDNNLPQQILEPERPTIRDIPGGFGLRWRYVDIEINAYVTHITDKGIAEVTLFYSTKEHNQENKERLLLSTNRVDFLSPTQKANLTRQIENIGYLPACEPAYLDWERKVNDIALAVMQNCRQDEPIREVMSNPDITLVPDYLLKPLLYKGHPNVIFGDKGSLKSLMALICAYIVQLPYVENRLNLIPEAETSCICLYLDYEDNENSFTKRWTAIQRGFHVRDDLEMPIYYKRMDIRLADAVQTLQPEIEDRHIKLLIVDSLGPAARGNLNDPEPAIEYHQALRTLGITSLTLAHRAKNMGAKTGSVFGSVFFSTLARSIWECTAEEEMYEGEKVICLEHIEANLSGDHERLGYKVMFDMDNSIITAEPTELKDTGLADKLSLPWRIKNTLLRDGPQETPELVTRFPDKKRETVERTIRRLREHHQIILLDDGKWAVSA
jgi:hypothetical protein